LTKEITDFSDRSLHVHRTCYSIENFKCASVATGHSMSSSITMYPEAKRVWRCQRWQPHDPVLMTYV